MIILGITGSIGMGKTTAAGILETLGVPIHGSDDCVHDLMKPGAEGYLEILKIFPQGRYPKFYNTDGSLDRKALGAHVFQDQTARRALETMLHPLVRRDQDRFIHAQKALGVDIVGLDIPLLYETGAEARVDYVIVVSAPEHIQKTRVLSRPGMTEERFNHILQSQMPDQDKRARADFVVNTGLGLAETTKALKKIVKDLRVQ